MAEDFVATAARIARQAHKGQHDKAGVDYIAHPARVAERVRTTQLPGTIREHLAAKYAHTRQLLGFPA